MKKILILAAFAASIFSNANAYDEPAIAVGVGAYQAFGDITPGMKVEWRGSDFESIPNLSPIAGGEVDGEGDLYGFGGFLYDWNICGDFYFTPSLAMGFYHHGSGKDLGGAFEFRETLEATYAISDKTRLGLSISHKSNASIYDHNPGTEEILAVYSFNY